MCSKGFQGLSGELFSGGVFQLFGKVWISWLADFNDVIAALSQRRQIDCEHSKAKIQVFAKLFFLERRLPGPDELRRSPGCRQQWTLSRRRAQ